MNSHLLHSPSIKVLFATLAIILTLFVHKWVLSEEVLAVNLVESRIYPPSHQDYQIHTVQLSNLNESRNVIEGVLSTSMANQHVPANISYCNEVEPNSNCGLTSDKPPELISSEEHLSTDDSKDLAKEITFNENNSSQIQSDTAKSITNSNATELESLEFNRPLLRKEKDKSIIIENRPLLRTYARIKNVLPENQKLAELDLAMVSRPLKRPNSSFFLNLSQKSTRDKSLATNRSNIEKNKLNLLGIFGKEPNLNALVMLPSGKIIKLNVGNEINGGKVIKISKSSLTYKTHNQSYRLALPK